MAGTSGLKWKLLPVVLLASLNHHGDSWGLTYHSGSALYQCCSCKRVKRFLAEYRPYCYGTLEEPHPRFKTRQVEDLEPTYDDLPCFGE
jgi:hypothetical protein